MLGPGGAGLFSFLMERAHWKVPLWYSKPQKWSTRIQPRLDGFIPLARDARRDDVDCRSAADFWWMPYYGLYFMVAIIVV